MQASVILASASPRRRKLLEELGAVFSVVPSAVDENDCRERDPRKRAETLSIMKATDVASLHPDAWVIGCDTLVAAHDGTILEKPADEADARRMAELQGGRTSLVHSGLTLIAPSGSRFTDVSTSEVAFKELSPGDIDRWIRSGMWEDRSGGFQIDGPGQLFIQKLNGDWTGVVGLPVFLLGQLSAKAGAHFLP